MLSASNSEQSINLESVTNNSQHALLINRSDIFLRLYGGLLADKGYKFKVSKDARKAEELVDDFMNNPNNKDKNLVLLVDCSREYETACCMKDTFTNQDYLSRLKILVTTEHQPIDCRLSTISGVDHIISSNGKGVANFLDKYK